MITLVVMTERYEARQLFRFATNGGQSWRYVSSVIKSKSQGREILCFGDSQVNFGVVPAVLEEETGKSAYNLSLHSGSAPSSYFLLRRAVNSGSRPGAIVVDFEYKILADGPASPSRPYAWAELLSLREAFELIREARDADFLAAIFVNRTLRSARHRFDIRDTIMAALKGEPDHQSMRTMGFWRNWNRNQGALIKPKDPSFVDAPVRPLPVRPLPGDWHCDPTNAVYVRKFLELARQIKARVYWLLPPVSPGTQCAVDSRSDEAMYLSFVRTLQVEYPHVVVIDARRAGFKSDVFLDGVHLACEGAVALSARIGKTLRTTWDQTTRTSRWIDLPAYAPPSSHAAVEDLGYSFGTVPERTRRPRAPDAVGGRPTVRR
jgi:hypothetical protein